MAIHHYYIGWSEFISEGRSELGRFIPAFKGLEPYAGKFASTVLRGERVVSPLTYPVLSRRDWFKKRVKWIQIRNNMNMLLKK